MRNVEHINFRPPSRIWVCACGCSTFEVLEGGEIRCPVCETISEGADAGAWYDTAKEADETEEAPMRDIHGNGSVEFAKERVRCMASKEDAKLLVVAESSGAVSTWADYGNDEQRDWMLEKLDEAKKLISAHRFD